MKQKTLALLLTIIVVVATAGCSGPTFELGDPLIEIARTICFLFAAIKLIVGSLAVFFMVVAGFKWLGSRDNPQARNDAKKIVEGVIVGLVIVYIAASIVGLIVGNSSYNCDETGLTSLVPSKV